MDDALVFRGVAIRTMGPFHSPLFHGGDVAAALRVDLARLLACADDDEIARDTDGEVYVNEAVLFSLGREMSKSATALNRWLAFRNWICREVLPELVRREHARDAAEFREFLSEIANDSALRFRLQRMLDDYLRSGSQ